MPLYRFGPFILNSEERFLVRDGARVALTGKTVDILTLLAEAGGRLVDRAAFQARIWPDTVVEERNLTVHISTLRKALNNGGTVEYIQTVPKAGYRLTVPVEVLTEQATPRATSAPETAPAAPPRRKLAAALAAGLLLALAGGTAWWTAATPERPNVLESVPAPVITLAVLPFATAGLPENERYLGLGIADSIITRLGSLPGLGVRPLGSVRELGSTGDPAAAGKRLQVDAVLDGLIQREDDRLRITAHLVDAQSGLTRWSERFELPLAGLFRLQDAISMRVATALLPRLPPVEQALLQQEMTRSPEAYLTQLQARVNMNQGDRDSLYKALEQYQHALKLDPDYPQAHGGLARTYLMLTSTTLSRPLPIEEALPLAKGAAQRALELDPRIGEAHAVLGRIGYTYEWDWRGGGEAMRRAVEASPNSAEAMEIYGWYLAAMGRRDEAQAMLLRARQIDPLRIPTLEYLAFAQWYAGDARRALATLGEAIAIAPGARRPRFRRMVILEHLRAPDEALAERLAWIRLLGRPPLAEKIETLYAREGHRAALLAWIDFLLAIEQWWEAAELWMVLDEPDKALDLLERCVATRCDAVPLLREHPAFRPLHDAPRYQALLQKVGLDRSL